MIQFTIEPDGFIQPVEFPIETRVGALKEVSGQLPCLWNRPASQPRPSARSLARWFALPAAYTF